ncbi:MAG: hypothetical protein SFV24_16820 [Gemmatimonadales bacterium]|nr:hypothetical protein [Gemmatimonadales bacterium]
MFTYQRQPRHIRLLDTEAPQFPVTGEITFTLAPGQVFGTADGPLRAARIGSDFHAEWDANADRDLSRPIPGFTPVQLKLAALGGEFEVRGNAITFRTVLQSFDDLQRHVQLLLFALPAGLSALLPDPVYITATEGTVGLTRFRLEHIGAVTPLLVLDDSTLVQRVATALSNVEPLAQKGSVRLLAAHRYVHTAARLLAAGYSRWEFMGEVVLNYAKALEILFGDPRDAQRAGMRTLGMPDLDIETRFIPVTLLRDFLDVAHPKLAQLDGGRLKGLYLYLVGLEGDFQELLKRAVDGLASGTWVPSPTGTTELDSAQLRTLDRILAADHLHREKQSKSAAP